jgi:polygalacturonase
MNLTPPASHPSRRLRYSQDPGLGRAVQLLTACLLCAVLSCSTTPRTGGPPGWFEVRSFGARGDGTTLDTQAVNAAITAAHAAGGGTVFFPAGTYACHSVHLQSHVSLYLDQGAVLAAAPPSKAESYDPPEPNPFDPYEDFGHSHFHNSLIWGENLTDVAIGGPGMIDGQAGLTRGSGGDADPSQPGGGVYGVDTPRYVRYVSNVVTTSTAKPLYPQPRDTLPAGVGNKAISLKLCRNVTLRDFTVRAGGHFALLATGVDNLTLDNLTIDTNRDGFDIDSCRSVRVSNCAVNSPWDDGICLKADFALGYNRPCEDVTITNCQVSGFACTTLLDGRRLPINADYDHGGGGTGRIKFGTESNGGFRNITVSNCTFNSCRGLALETVDGGPLEDVTIDNLTMRHPVNSPIFLRLGSRNRGPADQTITGTLARINISNVVVYDADPRYASIIAGVPGHEVTDVKLSHIQIFARGGGSTLTRDWATTQPDEREDKYPEPSMFGQTAAYGFYVRHASGVEFNDVACHVADEDLRSAFVLDDVSDAKFVNVDAEQTGGVPPLATHDVRNVTIRDFPNAKVTPEDPPTQ